MKKVHYEGSQHLRNINKVCVHGLVFCDGVLLFSVKEGELPSQVLDEKEATIHLLQQVVKLLHGTAVLTRTYVLHARQHLNICTCL